MLNAKEMRELSERKRIEANERLIDLIYEGIEKRGNEGFTSYSEIFDQSSYCNLIDTLNDFKNLLEGEGFNVALSVNPRTILITITW